MADVTQRKSAEEALRESEERFRSAFKHAVIGMALTAPDGRFLKVNQSLCKMLGYSEQELMSTCWQAITHPDDIDMGSDHMRRILCGESDSCQFEKRYLHKAGYAVCALLSFSLVRDADGNPIHFISQIQDISERKRAEEALRESEERFRSAFEQAAIGMALVAPNGRMIRVNHACSEIIGYSAEELTSLDWRAITHPDDLEIGEEHVRRALDGEIDSFQYEKRYLNKQGQVVLARLTSSLLRDHEGRPLYFISQIEDITERRRAEEQLQKAREELEAKAERQLLRRNPYGLTFRELTVLHLVAAGRADKEIGTELGISPLTAQKHVSNILAKMDAASRTEAAARAVREGLLE